MNVIYYPSCIQTSWQQIFVFADYEIIVKNVYIIYQTSWETLILVNKTMNDKSRVFSPAMG